MTESFPSRYGVAGVSPAYPVRGALAKALRAASGVLARMASDISAAEARNQSAEVSSRSAAGNVYACPQLEFYAEAGAAEGALFADGQLVGYVPGVCRL